MNAPKFLNLKVTTLMPSIPAEFRKLLPSIHVRETVEFELKNCSAAFANAIRRVIMSEFPTKSFDINITAIETDDPDIIHNMVARRFCLLPISQDVPTTAKFLIDVTNRTPQTIEIKSSEIKELRGKDTRPQRIVNETFTLFALLPGRRFRAEFGVVENLSRNFGGHTVSGSAISLPTSLVYNTYMDADMSREESRSATTAATGSLPASKPVSQTDYRDFIIKFTSNGTIDAKVLLTRTCKIIVDRLMAAMAITPAVNGSELIVDIPDETATIGNLIMQSAIESFPECTCVYSDIAADGLCRVRIIDNEPNRIYNDVIANLIEQFNELASQI